ncbi:MAG TPA: capsule assembly Wzi family protein [Flavihumibacter sp.]|nr:capsule assembly Wzi family protein [Flavihumibacter sp.]
MINRKIFYTATAALLLFIFAASQPLLAQSLPVGSSILEDYFRREQIKGERDSLVSFLVRPLVARNKAAADSLFQTTVEEDVFLKGRGRFRVLPASIRQQYNTHHPFGWNDGPMIPANGYQAYFTAGFFVAVGDWLTVQLQPELVYAANKDFATFPAGHTDSIWRAYYAFANDIDNPERYGSRNYTRVFAGQSSIRFNYKKLSLGVSTESLWWGPGIRNSLIMSNNAPGFLHLSLNSRAPMKTFLGHVEWQLIGGVLENSGIYPLDTTRTFEGQQLYIPKPDHRRYINAMTISWQPKWIPNLFIGFSRAFYQYNNNIPKNANGYLPVFTSFFKGQGNDDIAIGRDQLLSASFRWVLPREKAEIYAAYGRNDHAQNSEDLLLEPEHSRAYLIGLHKIFNTRKNREVEVLLEMTQTQEPATGSLRALQPWYAHYQTRHGYTNLGQVIGAGIGPGGNSQTLGVSWNKGIQKTGFFVDRIVHNNDFYYAAFGPMNRSDVHWVDLAINAYKTWRFQQILLSANASFIRSFNYQWRYKDNPAILLNGNKDINNLQLGCTVSYLFGK